MKEFKEHYTQILFERNFISQTQKEEIAQYRALKIFSLNAELKFFLYLSVLVFTSGIGLLIYQNIDTIGHSILIFLLALLTFVCYYFSFKKSFGFKKEQTQFENPIMDYVVLTANLLSCSLITYIQFQYNTFGTNYALATLIPTAIGIFSGYYFDNKNVLSLAITGLAASIGLSVTPQSLLQNEFYDTQTLSYSAIALGLLLLSWNYYSIKTALKTHFSILFVTFALHLISISCLNNLLNTSYSFVYAIILVLSTYYFYRLSKQLKAVSIFFFTVLYAFFGFNICTFLLIDYCSGDYIFDSILFFYPFYTIGSIYGFIQLIKNFNKNIQW